MFHLELDPYLPRVQGECKRVSRSSSGPQKSVYREDQGSCLGSQCCGRGVVLRKVVSVNSVVL